ncbi:MAG: ABC transporter substrate-binding protein [Boseongicola sp.]
MHRFSRILNVLALAGCLAGAAFGQAPGRVVSMNLCTDQLAMLLAEPGQLISVTKVSTDPLSSTLVETALSFPLNSGRAEEIYAMAPDLVLANEYSDPTALQLLRELGVEVRQYAVITRLDQIPGVLRAVGVAMGREAAADALSTNVELRLDELTVRNVDRPTAAFFFANGYSLGTGTLSHDIITRAGFDNLSQVLGHTGGGRISLEELLMNRPDVIVTSAGYPGASRSEEIVDHPALSGIPRVLSGPEWVCGAPAAIIALENMVAAREALASN